jgi:predicted nucleic acid-binding protein
MILIDASVLVRYLRTASPAIREVLASADCAICGVTRAEILHGARNTKDAKDLREAMDAFVQLPIQDATWDHLGDQLALLRARGLPMPFQDVLLAVVAIDHEAELWSYDAHFRTIQGVAGKLQLFDGPTA